MAKEFDRTNTGLLFNNQDRKEKDTDRDYGGSINVDGVDYWLSGWIKISNKTGAKFVSLSVQPKVQKAAVVAQPTASNGAHSRDDDMSDEIPF